MNYLRELVKINTINDLNNIKFYEKITNKNAMGFNYVTEGNFLNKSNIIIIGPEPVTE